MTEDTIMALRMPKDLKEEFFEVTRRDERTPSQVVRKLIKQWLAEQKQAGA